MPAVVTGRGWLTAAAGGAIACFAVGSVSRAVGTTWPVVLTRACAAGLVFGAAIVVTQAIVGRLGDRPAPENEAGMEAGTEPVTENDSDTEPEPSVQFQPLVATVAGKAEVGGQANGDD